ncbi:MAG: hypothetical protein JNM56_17115 [Planctomycetia bacterium]|nr:hypothetical protein [Planctomycetia bacterium]
MASLSTLGRAASLSLVLLCLGISDAADPKPGGSWPAPVKDWVPVQPGEHPRLFFRKADLPELKKRAETPEGKAILARLKMLLGGGEAMPAVYMQTKKAYEYKGEPLPVGAYSLWHGSGFGLLYQLTGEKKYAELGKESVEKALSGQRDRDDRYSFVVPGGALRAGPSIGAIAMAYDLCYDGWDEEFRKKVALALQNYDQDKGGPMTLRAMAVTPKHAPGSNHYGCQVGGAGLAILAIKGDPGTDEKLLAQYDQACQQNVLKALTQGFGDGGYFWEHAGPSQIGSDTALVPYLQALKVAAGKDYISPRPNGQWLSMRWAMDMIPKDGKPYYPCRHPGAYGTELFSREGLSRGGQFAQGFGAVSNEQKPALLWAYNQFVEPDEKARTYDTVSPYPHRAVLALVNWPIGIQPKNPAEVLARTRQDSVHGYYVFRNQWKDENDILVTALLGARPEPGGPEPVMVWGLGLRTTFGSFKKAKATHFQTKPDGSGVLAAPGGVSLAVDFSGASGAPALLALVGEAVKPNDQQGKVGVGTKTTTVTAGGKAFTVMTLQKGPAPEVKVDGDKVVVGGQTLTFDGAKIILAK